MGGKGEEYLVLEMHYDNPRMIAGIVDNSGMEFFYTNEAPENRAGLLVLGQQSLNTLIIPPGADNFVVNALTPQQCTEKVFSLPPLYVKQSSYCNCIFNSSYQKKEYLSSAAFFIRMWLVGTGLLYFRNKF